MMASELLWRCVALACDSYACVCHGWWNVIVPKIQSGEELGFLDCDLCLLGKCEGAKNWGLGGGGQDYAPSPFYPRRAERV
jgi:hypothetical protein